MARIPRSAILKAALPETEAFHVIHRFARRAALAKKPLNLLSILVSFACALLHYQRLRLTHYCVMPTHMHTGMRILGGAGEAMTLFLHRFRTRAARLLVALVPSLTFGSIFGQRAATVPKEPGLPVLLDMMYQHYNPVRAGLAGQPDGWLYSSYHFYATGEIRCFFDVFLTPPPEYLALGATPAERQAAFRQLSEAFERTMTSRRDDDKPGTEWKMVGDPVFVQKFLGNLDQVLTEDESPDGGGGLSVGRGTVSTARRASVNWSLHLSMAGDPDAGSFGDAGRLPACCWMHMDERARMELKTKLGRDWDEFRRARPTGRGAPMFLPSLELLEQFALVPAGFTVNWLRGPFIGLRDAAADLLKLKEEEQRCAQPGLVVDGGAGASPEVNAAAEVAEQSPPVAAGELPARGSPEESAVLVDTEADAASGEEAAAAAASSAAGSASGSAEGGNRSVVKCGAMAADAVIDLDAWSKEHSEVLALCRINIEELLSILRAPACPPRVSRKRPQVTSVAAAEPGQAPT